MTDEARAPQVEIDKSKFSLEERKFALETEKFELEKRRFGAEEERALSQKRFWHQNFAATTTFSIAALGLMLSVVQVLVAHVEKDRDLAIAEIHRQADAEAAEKHEFREFLKQHQDMIDKVLAGSIVDLEQLTSLASATFSPLVVQPLIDRLTPMVSTNEQKSTLAAAQARVDQVKDLSAAPLVFVHYRSPEDQSLAQQVATMLIDTGYRVPPIERVTQQTNGDVRFFHAEDADAASRIAELVHNRLKASNRDQQISPIDVGKAFPNVSRGRFEVWIPAPGP